LKNSLRFQVPAFIAVRLVLNTMIRLVYPFLPAFGRGMGVDLWLLSLAVTFRSASGIIGPFLASIADSRGRKDGMMLGLLLFTAGVGLMSVWPSYLAFVLMLALTLVGNLVFIPSMQAYLGDRTPYNRRGRILALMEFGWSLSFIIGVPLIGFIIARYGWRAPFPFLAGLGVLALAGLAWLVPKDPDRESRLPGLRANFRTVLTYPPALAGLLMAVSYSAGNEMVNLIFGVWMEDTFGLKVAALGAVAAMIGAAELSGETIVSGITDRLGKTWAVRLGLVLNCLAVLVFPLFGRSLTGALAGLFLFYITFEFTIVSNIPLISELLPSARATLMAAFVACTSVGRVLGDLIAPRLYTWGILAIALGTILLNLLALLALNHIRESSLGAESVLGD
jgi:predicted MFS family arabinose efflux permease